jgi:hypothetical protein
MPATQCLPIAASRALPRQGARQAASPAGELVELISPNSLRAGYASSAAARNIPAYRIRATVKFNRLFRDGGVPIRERTHLGTFRSQIQGKL